MERYCYKVKPSEQAEFIGGNVLGLQTQVKLMRGLGSDPSVFLLAGDTQLDSG